MTNRIITAHEAITRICRDLRYSRAHVAKILRANATKLGATLDSRWKIPARSERRLRDLVIRQSGPRYRLGERGPNAQR